jgi:hypothetical protein
MFLAGLRNCHDFHPRVWGLEWAVHGAVDTAATRIATENLLMSHKSGMYLEAIEMISDLGELKEFSFSGFIAPRFLTGSLLILESAELLTTVKLSGVHPWYLRMSFVCPVQASAFVRVCR